MCISDRPCSLTIHSSLSITICFAILTSFCTLGHLFVCGLSDLRVSIHILRYAPGKLHNFVHLCKTPAERHQLLQAYLSSGSLFLPTVQAVGDASEYDERLSVRKAGFTKETASEGINSGLQRNKI